MRIAEEDEAGVPSEDKRTRVRWYRGVLREDILGVWSLQCRVLDLVLFKNENSRGVQGRCYKRRGKRWRAHAEGTCSWKTVAAVLSFLSRSL